MTWKTDFACDIERKFQYYDTGTGTGTGTGPMYNSFIKSQ